MRELTFIFNVIDATYTDVDVDAPATALAGFDTSIVEDSIVAAISDYLSPANWGIPSGDSTRKLWRNVTTVRRNELIALVNSVEGVDYVGNLRLALGGDPLGTVDITLDGPAALSRPGDVTATVSAP